MAGVVHLSDFPTLSDQYKHSVISLPSENSDLATPSSSLNQRISLIRTDITKLASTSIVNAANQSLLGGGGVDGAIHAAAGPSLLEECTSLDGCDIGSAKITSAYDLPSKYVIHTVGPIYATAKRQGKGYPPKLLRGCYRSSLDLAEKVGGSIAFSCVSTGVYGYPSDEAAYVACTEVRKWLEEREDSKASAGEGSGVKKQLDRIIFCCFLEKDETAYRKWLPQIFPPSESDLVPPKANTEPEIEEGQRSGHLKDTKSTMSQELEDKEWESVEKPSLASSTIDNTSETDAVDIDAETAAVAAAEESEAQAKTSKDLAEEGVEIEAANPEDEEGVKVEKPAGAAENTLGKDW